MTQSSIVAKQAQLTCVIEALRALNYYPHEPVAETDRLLEEARAILLDAYELLATRPLVEIPPPSAEQRTEWLEFRCFEQQTLGLR